MTTSLLSTATARVGEAVDELVVPDPAYLPASEREALAVELHRHVERLRGVLARVLAVSNDVAEARAARSPGEWLAHLARSEPGSLRRLERLGEAMTRRWPQLGDAVLQGRMGVDQAEAILAGLDLLPAAVGAELRARAEAHLVEQAALFAPQPLRVLARRALEVVAPEVADEEEQRLLQRELDAARAATTLTLRPNGDGTTDLRGRLPDASAARLRTYLEAFAAPRRQTSAVVRRPPPRRLGEALCSLLEAMPRDVLPLHGGSATTIVVTVPLDALESGVGVATSGDLRLPAGEVRRLACRAGLLPAVLGRKSEVLDLGRTSRLFSPAQRRALALRDRGCRAEGCLVPAAWCEAHHLDPWSRSGRTDLAAGILLCSHHHHRVHEDRYTTTRTPTGRIAFHPRR